MHKCKQEGCSKSASYNIVGTKPAFCKQHKSPDMVLVTSPICIAPSCKKRADFNSPGEYQKLYCYLHKQDNMITMKGQKKQCLEAECATFPTFNLTNHKEGIYCKKHATKTMVRVNGTPKLRCLVNNCLRSPQWFLNGQISCFKHKPTNSVRYRGRRCSEKGCNLTPKYRCSISLKQYCPTHKTQHAVRFRGNFCHFDGCQTHPYFALPGEKASSCKKHKSNGMTSVQHIRCEEQNCETAASFNLSGLQPRFCNIHRTPNMCFVRTFKLCWTPECTTRPSFNFEGQTIGISCKDHKDDGMICVVRSYCDIPECSNRSIYHDDNNSSSRRCHIHKEEHMRFHNTNPPCQHERCSVINASYGLSGMTPTKCALHREVGMQKNPRKRCKQKQCTNLAVFGTFEAINCDIHKMEGEINMIEKNCSQCNLISVVSRNGTCEYCEPNAFRTNHNHLVKQRYMQRFIETKGIQFTQVDKQIDMGVCGRERPDFLLDCGKMYIAHNWSRRPIFPNRYTLHYSGMRRISTSRL
jgi:hypothetical protein